MNITPSDLVEWLEAVLQIARRAGEEILDVYNDEASFEVETKGDGSPLTMADRRAHELIVKELPNVGGESLPILSEESSGDEHTARLHWSRFWLVDPLDGTKEFVKRNGEFTVNIALIDNGAPVLGVVHVPVTNESYLGVVNAGAWFVDANGDRQPISTQPYDKAASTPPTVVASRSHAGGDTGEYLNNLTADLGEPEVRSMGSSLKICLVASGAAHVYPRLGPTCEWDTGAAHAVLIAAGGAILAPDGNELDYNKPDVLNPWFFATGGGQLNWLHYLGNIEVPEKSA